MIKSVLYSKYKNIQKDQNRHIFFKGAVGSFAIKIIGAGFLFAVQVVLARLCGTEQYGFYAYALSWMTILSIVAKLGFDTSLLRFVPEYLVKKEWGRVLGIIRSSFFATALASIILTILGNIVLIFLQKSINPDWMVPLRLMLVVLPFYTLTVVRQAALRGFKNVVLAELPESVVRPILMIGCSFILFKVLGQLDAAHAWIGQLVAVVLSFILGTFLLFRRIPNEVKESPATHEHNLWLRTSLPMLLMSSMNIILNQASVIILGFYRSSEEIAIFAAAGRIVILATFILMAINSIAAPMISELFHSNKQDELQSLLGFSAKGIAVFTALTTVFLMALGRPILGLFGHDFVQGYVVLLILLIGQAIKSLMGPASFLLNLTGYQDLTAKVMSFAVLISIVLNFLFIPQWGVMGAAIASGATMALWNVTLVVLDRKIVNLDPSIFYFFKGKK